MTMPQTTRGILALQSLLIVLQILNVATGDQLPMPQGGQVVLSALIGGLQYYLQQLGNSVPPQPPAAPKP